MNLLLALMLLLGEQGDRPADIKVDFTATVTLVNIPLRVHKDGQPYRKLRLDQLSLVENGVGVPLRDLRSEETPLVLHFLFDLSTSNARNVIVAKKIADELVDKMRHGDRARLSFFSGSYQPLTDYIADKKTLRKRLRFLTPVGSTALYDGLASAMEDLGRNNGSRVLVLFSDGHDLLSRTTEAELMGQVRNLRIPIVFVQFGDNDYSTKPLLEAQTRFMKRLAAASGGKVVSALQTRTRTITRELDEFRQRYQISFAPPGPEDVDLWRSLMIRIEDCPECELSYRRAYKISTLQ